ncbi:MULE domain-containing protein, partial [Aphis craccivora]
MAYCIQCCIFAFVKVYSVRFCDYLTESYMQDTFPPFLWASISEMLYRIIKLTHINIRTLEKG